MGTVLVVDDKVQIRDALKFMLVEEQHQVLEAANGEEAIAMMTERGDEIDLVILDINMPITDGWEALRIIKDEENGWPNKKVIILTVHKEPESALKAWGIGAVYYCTKPFSVKTLVETVNKALVA